jgi:hypothetical protein
VNDPCRAHQYHPGRRSAAPAARAQRGGR